MRSALLLWNTAKKLAGSRSFWLACLIYLFLAFTLSFGVFVFSEFLSSYLNLPHRDLLKGFGIGILLGVSTVYLLNRFKFRLFGAHSDAFDLQQINTWYLSLILAFSLWIFVTLIQYISIEVDIRNVTENWAASLVVLGSLASIGGLYYAGKSIQQYRRQITSFTEFANQLTLMIEDTRGDENKDYLRILAYTPIPGSLALEDRVYRNLYEAIINPKTRLEVVCLEETDLTRWFDSFKNKKYRNGTITDTKIEVAKKDISRLISSIHDPESQIKRIFAENHPSIRVSAEDLPDFYLFFNDTKAIVVTPFFLPIVPDEVPKTEAEGKPKTEFEDEPVEMVGFVTTDTKILQGVKKYYLQVRSRNSKLLDASVLDMR